MFNELYSPCGIDVESQCGVDIGVEGRWREREDCSRAVEHVRTGRDGSVEQACDMHTISTMNGSTHQTMRLISER